MYLLILFLTIVFISYKYLKANYDYWKNLDVPHPEVSLFFGNLRDALSMKKCLGQIYTDIYNTYKDVPYVGFYKIRQPGILVRDPEIIRNILVKDFTYFQQNDINVDEKSDPILAKNPFLLRGHKWKVTRSNLSNCFSSGKMKTILPLMVDVSKNLVNYLELESLSKESGLETKELSTKFTTDNVASCAFGLQGKSFENPKAVFREMGRKILEPSFIMNLKHLSIFVFPSLAKLMHIKFIPDDVVAYFKNVVVSTLKFRQETNLVRNDFLDIMNQLKDKPSEYGYNDDDVTAHALSFFVDGYETSSITLSFTLYELAANEDIQEKLKYEIDSVLARHDGKITYEAVQEMLLLDSVILESLRLHPPGMFLSKLCTDDYPLPLINNSSKRVILKAGTPVVIPVYGLHYDEKYFPDPTLFKPDRFREENKSKIIKGTYLPFGEGPRVCLGQRFALLQVKVAVVAIVKNFELRVNKKTIVPLEIDPKYLMLLAKGGLWLDYTKRH